MNKVQKVLIGLGITGAVGLTYAITALRGLPEVFDWEEDEPDE
jgi:3-polyprenyl-4-hydroxybenzoate decarboxylase